MQLRVALVLAACGLAMPSLARGPAGHAQSPASNGSVVRGRVLAADTGEPLGYIRVSLASTPREGIPRITTTTADGRYEFPQLPAGRYSMWAGGTGYLTVSYGQRRPLEAGQPLSLTGADTETVDFRLPRPSLIAGRITDGTGEPVAGVRVVALRPIHVAGQRRLATAESTLTDGSGAYRLANLIADSYYVVAITRQTRMLVDGSVIGYAPTFLPGSTSVDDARRVAVGVAGRVTDADIALVRGRAARVSGTVVNSAGRTLPGQTVYLVEEAPGTGTTASQSGGADIAANGTFAILNLRPGSHKLVVRDVLTVGRDPHVEEAAVVRVEVNGKDRDNVRIVTSRGGLIAGQVMTDEGTPVSVPSQTRIVGDPLVDDVDLKVGEIEGSGVVKGDGTFLLEGLFGPNRIRAKLPDGWMLRAVRADGLDVTDATVELRSRDRLSGIQVIVTNRVARLAGTVTDEKEAPVPDGTVVVFHSDPGKWADESRYVRAARPDQHGHFELSGLPPGEYLAVAIRYVEDGRWTDPEYLQSLRRHARPIVVADGGTQTLSLGLVEN